MAKSKQKKRVACAWTQADVKILRNPDRYPLVALAGAGYRQRTLKNVLDSAATVIVHANTFTGGTKLTRDFCQREKKPFVLVDAATVSLAEAVDAVGRFVLTHRVAALNVAGPRASGWEGGHAFTRELVCGVIRFLGVENAGIGPQVSGHDS